MEFITNYHSSPITMFDNTSENREERRSLSCLIQEWKERTNDGGCGSNSRQTDNSLLPVIVGLLHHGVKTIVVVFGKEEGFDGGLWQRNRLVECLVKGSGLMQMNVYVSRKDCGVRWTRRH